MKRTARLAIRSVLLAALLAAPFAHAAEKAAAPGAKPAAPKATAAPAPKATLVFFINPAGRPCQMQDQILLESKG